MNEHLGNTSSPLDKPNQTVVPSSHSFSTLFGEIVASSGPRKEFGEPNQVSELGEDCGGLFFLNDGSQFLWIADGTSNMSHKGPFSSRILAQDLGRVATQYAISTRDKLQKDSDSEPIFSRLLENTVQKVYAEWNHSLNSNSPYYLPLLEELKTLNRKGPGNIFFEFSSTLVLGYLNSRGDFRSAGVGDSYLIVNGEGQTRFYALAKGSITFHLRLRESTMEFVKFVPKIQSFRFDHIDLGILSTDGTRETVKYLYEVLRNHFECNLENIFNLKRNLARIVPNTQDDKIMGWMGRFYES